MQTRPTDQADRRDPTDGSRARSNLTRVYVAAGGIITVGASLAVFLSNFAHSPLQLVLLTLSVLAGGAVVIAVLVALLRHWNRRIRVPLVGVLIVGVLLASGAVVLVYRRGGPPLSEVTIAVGSEDVDLFNDSGLKDVLADHGLQMTATAFGSLTIATDVRANDYDLALPSSAVTTDALLDNVGRSAPARPLFTTPLVVLTWKPLRAALERAGLATLGSDGMYQFHIGKYLDLARRGVTWTQLAGDAYPNPQHVQLRITDPGQSNSGLMFLAAASYVLNSDAVVSDPQQAAAIATRLKPLLDSMGELDTSTKYLFDEYLSQGMSGRPLVLSYESLYVARVMQGGLPPDAVMMYVDPIVNSEHTLVQLNGGLSRRGFDALTNDPKVQQIAEAPYGFRGDPAYVANMSHRGIAVEQNLDAIPVPKLGRLKEMLDVLAG
jgi:hypothetical protein